MRRLVVQPLVIRDVRSLLQTSYRNFGQQARDRYQALIAQAYADLLKNPLRAGSVPRADLPDDLRVYHLRHARARLAKAMRPASPRHFVVFTFDDAAVQIVRILHESMDLSTQLASPPPEDEADESPA